MKPAQAKKVINEALKSKFLSLESLDALLEEDATFDANMRRLLRYLDESVRVEVPTEAPMTGKYSARVPKNGKAGGPENGNGVKRKVPANLLQDFYFTYLQELRNVQGMDREDEYRFAKRLEFFKERMAKEVRAASLPAKEKRYILENLRCLGNIDPIHIRPLCERIGRCAAEKSKEKLCHGYNKCRSLFVEKNLYLVIKLVQPYRTYGVPVMDLIQEGNAALIRAVEKFDWRKGVRLQTYAEFWIRQAVERCISANKGIVRVPNYIQQKMRRFKREGKISGDMDRITASEISDAFGTSNEVAGRILETGQRPVSLDSGAAGEDSPCLGSLISADGNPPFQVEEKKALKLQIQETIQDLTDQERTILFHRFGMNGADIKTLGELGEMLNVSRERVRQILLRSFQKMKKPKFLKKLEAFI